MYLDWSIATTCISSHAWIYIYIWWSIAEQHTQVQWSRHPGVLLVASPHACARRYDPAGCWWSLGAGTSVSLLLLPIIPMANSVSTSSMRPSSAAAASSSSPPPVASIRWSWSLSFSSSRGRALLLDMQLQCINPWITSFHKRNNN